MFYFAHQAGTTSKDQSCLACVLKNNSLNFIHATHGSDLTFYEDKKVMDDFYALGSNVSSPLVQDGVVYFGSTDGYVYALRLN